MSFELRMYFSGLCLFTPGSCGRSTASDDLRTALQDLSEIDGFRGPVVEEAETFIKRRYKTGRSKSAAGSPSADDLADWFLERLPDLVADNPRVEERLRDSLRARDETFDEYLVLMPDARDPGRVRGTRGLGAHTAMVQFANSDRIRNGFQFTLFPDSNDRLNGLWILDREDLWIGRPDAADGLTVRRCSDPTSTQPANHGEAECFRWLTPAIDRHGRQAAVKPEFKQPTIEGPALDHLSGRVHLCEGILRSAALTVHDTGHEFLISRTELETDRARNIEQASATVMELAVEIDDDSVELYTTSISEEDKSKVVRRLQLEPDYDGRVEMWVMNREVHEVVNQLPHPLIQLGRQRIEEEEFRYFHPLLEEAPGLNDVPVGVRLGRASQASDFRPCENPAMRRLYWPQLAGGEGTDSGPCAPASAK